MRVPAALCEASGRWHGTGFGTAALFNGSRVLAVKERGCRAEVLRFQTVLVCCAVAWRLYSSRRGTAWCTHAYDDFAWAFWA